MQYTYPKSLRLLKRKQIDRIFKQAIPLKHDGFLVLSRKNDLTHPRLGLIIAKKNIKLATQRNQLRRYLRESFRLNQAMLAGWDIVILVKKSDLLEEQDKLTCLDKLWGRWKKRCNQASSV